jgi:glucan phosphorylase
MESDIITVNLLNIIGIFKQKIEMGYQIEEPDYWLQ